MVIFVSNISADCLPYNKPPIEVDCGEYCDIPRTPAEIIDTAFSAIKKREDIECLSEYPILVALKMVRTGELPLSELKIVYCGLDGIQQVLRADAEGELIDRMPNGFFDERVDWLF